jgi:hypothetical protein
MTIASHKVVIAGRVMEGFGMESMMKAIPILGSSGDHVIRVRSIEKNFSRDCLLFGEYSSASSFASVLSCGNGIVWIRS